MVNDLFLLALAVLSVGILSWGFRALPQEQWQIAAAIPVAKTGAGEWQGLNLTYYGVFHAGAYGAGVAMMLVLMGAVGVSLPGTITMVALLLAFCVPASKVVARLVERKAATFTVGGAVFIGLLMGPWILIWANHTVGPLLGFEIPVATGLAAGAIGYALGEGVGRLACVSFGCCYGKPLSRISPQLRRLFERYSFVFTGQTKKVAYEGGLEGEKVVPVQAITAVLFVATALVAAEVFLRGHHRTAFGLSLAVTQGWRAVSETLRADHRGGGRVSAYQVMALLAIVYLFAALPFIPAGPGLQADIVAGLRVLWDPWVILCLQGLCLAIFLHTGRSVVTGATLSFHVRRDRI
jgi:hypothetical protein